MQSLADKLFVLIGQQKYCYEIIIYLTLKTQKIGSGKNYPHPHVIPFMSFQLFRTQIKVFYIIKCSEETNH